MSGEIHPPRQVSVSLSGSKRAEALLAATSSGTVSLLLGSGTGRLAEVIPRLGGSLVAAEWGLPENESSSAAERLVRVQVTPSVALPFADACFDSVFAPDAFNTLASIATVGSVRTRHVQLLRECVRVLKPGGRIVASFPNATGLSAVLRLLQRINGSLPFLPHRLRDRVRRLTASRPPSRGYSRQDASRLLRESGFGAVNFYLPWPRRDYWKTLVPDHRAGSERLASGGHWDGATEVLLDGISRLGLQERLILEYCFVAEKKGRAAAGSAGQPVLDTIVGLAGGRIDESRPLVLFDRSDSIATFLCGDSFFKLALRPIQAQRFAAEVEAIDRARSTAVNRHMISYTDTGAVHCVPYIAFPAAEVIKYRNESEKVAVLQEAFDLLAAGSADTRLESTDAWSRIFSDESRAELGRLGAGDILDHTAHMLGGRQAPAGLVHGDLHAGNILRKDGRLRLIDWDRFESCSPILLDRCSAAVHILLSRELAGERARPRMVALTRLIEKHAKVPLLDRIEETSGELSWRETVALYIVNSASWAASQNITRLSLPAEERVRRELALCRDCLDL